MQDEHIKIINGKFMKGDIEVPPEIGNIEQINALKEANKRFEEKEKLAKEGKLPILLNATDISFNLECIFTCICGKQLKEVDKYIMVDSIDEVEDAEWEGGIIECPNCRRRYFINDLNNAELI